MAFVRSPLLTTTGWNAGTHADHADLAGSAGAAGHRVRYSATQNDGRITSQKNNVSGEEVVYLSESGLTERSGWFGTSDSNYRVGVFSGSLLWNDL